ncbi:MAG: DUF1778 domain-containing protein [Pseudomonadota bacterium]
MPSIDSQTGKERTERLEARITQAQKDLFKQAADLEGRTLSDFLIQAASDAALRTVQAHLVISLTTQEQKAFVAALLNPPAPGPRLRSAARRYRKLME